MPGQRDPPERREGVGAQVGRRLLGRARQPPQPGDDVVVGDDDAERGVADDDREQPEVDAEGDERRPQRDAGHDARQGDRQDQEERDGLLPEERVALDGRARASVPEHEGDRRSPRVATISEFTIAWMTRRVGGRLAEPVEREPGRRPGLDPARVEGVDRRG